MAVNLFMLIGVVLFIIIAVAAIIIALTHRDKDE